MKNILIIILILNSLNIYSQTDKKIKRKLKKVNSITQIDQLKEKYPDWKIEIIEIYSRDTLINSKITSLKKGEIITVKKDSNAYVYKLIEINKQLEFRVSHLYLNGKKLSIEEINSLRKTIIEKYNNGILFSELSKKIRLIQNTK